MKSFSLIYCLLIMLLLSCNEINPKGEKEVRDFVKQWNETHTQLKSSYLGRDYMDVVTYYGNERTRAQVQQDKNLLFEQFPDYKQRVLNDQIDITEEAGSYLVTFTNRISYNAIEGDYTFYLSLIYKNRAFKILREGVAENNKNLEAPIFPSARENKAGILKNRRLYGDFNGDGLSDYASVISPKIRIGKATGSSSNNKSIECEDGCNSIITFSNKELEAIIVKGAYESQLENLNDLNGDGADEIGFWDIKPTSKSLYIFDATNSKLLTAPVIINTDVHKNLSLIDVFKKTGPKKITVTHSAQVGKKWILKSEVITLD